MASIFLAFALLCSLFYIPCYYYIREINRENVVENHQRRLDTGMRTFAISINALSVLDDQLFENADYRQVQYPMAELENSTVSTLRGMVASYLMPYDMIAESGLTRGDEILFLRNHLSYATEFLNWQRFFSCEEDFFSQLIGAQCVLPAMHFHTTSYGSYEALTVAFRWSRTNDMYFFATYPLQTIFDDLVEPAALENGSIAVYAGSRLLASAGGEPKGSFHTISSVIDNNLHLRVEVQLADSFIDQKLAGMHSLVSVFVCVLAAAMILWIMVFAIAASRPVNRIGNALRQSSHLDAQPGSASDLVEGIQQLDSKLTDYSRQLDEQRERIRLQTLEKALYRGLYSAESVQELYEMIPNFPKKWRLALVQFTADETEMDEKSARTFFMEEVRKALSNRRVLSIGRNALLVIFSLTDPDSPEIRLKDVLTCMEAEGMPATYTLSPEYEDPTLLAEAFQQLEYETMVLQQMPSQPASAKNAPISMQQLHTLYLALQCGDGDAAVTALKNGASGVRDGADFFVAQYSYRMVANTLVRIKMESACNLNDIPIPVFRSGRIQQLFDEELPHCILRMTERMAQQRQDQSQTLEEDILRFIEENIANPQLCRTFVTDHFRISAPTLQKRLSASAGKTFSAYVEDLRMQRARQALQETDLSVQEISLLVGYANPNSFYKAYKRCFGEAPLSARQK